MAIGTEHDKSKAYTEVAFIYVKVDDVFFSNAAVTTVVLAVRSF